MRAVCVFCGSNPGANPAFLDQARAVGRLLAERGVTLVYGGGSVGLMGAAADAAMAAGGKVVGVIPKHLWDREVGHRDLSELHIVETMHERKAKMAELSDGFLILPGGIGTLEEFFEIWTWGQLGLHKKPFGVLNVDGYYSGLFGFLDTMTEQGFLHPNQRAMVQVSPDPDALLAALAQYQPPEVKKWLDLERT